MEKCYIKTSFLNIYIESSALVVLKANNVFLDFLHEREKRLEIYHPGASGEFTCQRVRSDLLLNVVSDCCHGDIS